MEKIFTEFMVEMRSFMKDQNNCNQSTAVSLANLSSTTVETLKQAMHTNGDVNELKKTVYQIMRPQIDELMLEQNRRDGKKKFINNLLIERLVWILLAIILLYLQSTHLINVTFHL